MHILCKAFFISALISLAVISADGQQIKLIQLPIFKDATWLVTSIAQDNRGYMWFGTKRNGLYRYDGYTLTPYKNQASNANSISYDAVESLFADSTGIVWIGTYGRGLDRFEPSSGTFTHFRFNNKNAASLCNDTVTSIIKDRQGSLWIGTYGGISRLDTKTLRFTSYRHMDSDAASLSCNLVRTIYQDKRGTIWVGTGSSFYEQSSCSSGGLNRLDIATGKFTRYLHSPGEPGSLTDNRVRAIFEDRYGTFYVGTAGDGLHTLDRRTGKFTHFFYDAGHPENLSRPPVRKNLGYVDDHITFINEDITGAIWIGTFAGLTRYDPRTKKIKHFQSFNDSSEKIKDNIGWTAYTSRDGVLWFSTIGKGNLYYVDPFLQKIDHYDIADQVNAIHKESPAVYWLGTQLNGLIRKDVIAQSQKAFPFPGITAILPDNRGQFWIGTIDDLFLFNPKTQTSVSYKKKLGIVNSEELIVSGLHLNWRQNLWIGTTKGLINLNTANGSVTKYRHNPSDTNSLSNNSVTSILEDRQGNLWVGAPPNGGLNFLNIKTNKFKHYLKGREITGTIFQDSAGDIWVGTNEGLYRFNTYEDNFDAVTDFNTGSPLNFVLNIMEDAQRNLWIVTESELLKLNKQRNNIIRFGKNEGIIPNTGYCGYYTGSDGHEIFFGDQSGYYDFIPEQLSINNRPPQILLTDFTVKGSRNTAQDNLLNQPELNEKEIALKYNENLFSFNLTAIHFSNPGDNKLIYMLEGYDKIWRESGAGQKAYYFNVPPGDYMLKVKAANGNGVWTTKNIPVHITPPWWKTWWAYIAEGLVIAGSIWLFVFYRSRSLFKEKKLLEQKIVSRTTEVVQQKEEISKQRDRLKETLEELQSTQTQLLYQKDEISKQRDKLETALEGLQNTQNQLVQREKMASLGELTAGIAHEIQNPLNFVKNFSEVNMELLNEINEAIDNRDNAAAKLILTDIKQNLEKIAHHGQRAASIVKGMLQHSRNSTNKKELTDINNLSDECLRLTFHGLRAKDKTFNAKMQTDFDTAIEPINIIPQDIGRVFLNIFTNAFYAVKEKQNEEGQRYEPTVFLSTRKEDNNIKVTISDNGTGIPRKVLDKIYQPFFTTKPTGEGTGLGLSLSYDIIKAHGGEINVTSKEGEGTEFKIILPAA